MWAALGKVGHINANEGCKLRVRIYEKEKKYFNICTYIVVMFQGHNKEFEHKN